MSTPSNPREAAERHYKRTGHPYQVRTASGRLVASARHVEQVEYLTRAGRDRVIWKRVESFGRVHWL